MHKEELITLHQMMVEIKEFFEKINPESSSPGTTPSRSIPPRSTARRWSTSTPSSSWGRSLPMR